VGAAFLTLHAEALRPLVQMIVAEVLARTQASSAHVPDRLTFSEPEAAALLGLKPHQLRDERRRGRIGASSIVGRRVRYVREDLIQYLASRRVGGE
jgi:hypothetical protein